MIAISLERCNGCGACVETCPNGAIYVVDDEAMVDGELCCACKACLTACPTGAITFVTPEREPVAEPVRVPVPRPAPAAVQVRAGPAPAIWRAKVLPAVGAALVWAGREVVPRLAGYFLDSLDRRASGQRHLGVTRTGCAPVRRGEDAGRRLRHRQRKGGRAEK
jgi:NAD-dependent dihydropyrimidine dehydrogenase PreA subunit